jgi:hypothetical protein
MDGLVTAATEDQRFSPPCRHQPHPIWYLLPPRAVEVCEFVDVVDFDLAGTATEFAHVGLEPFEEVRAFAVRSRRLLVHEDCVLPAFQREAPELCY